MSYRRHTIVRLETRPIRLEVREGTFLIAAGGPGLPRGGSLVIFLQIGEGQTCFILNPGRVIVFFWQGKNYSMQSYQSRLI